MDWLALLHHYRRKHQGRGREITELIDLLEQCIEENRVKDRIIEELTGIVDRLSNPPTPTPTSLIISPGEPRSKDQ